MCEDECAKGFKRRFKGIEMFLRRVAFNLGNSASQTEVKIISCIPIDVTDLQQKIVNLEKELQDVKGTSGDVSKREKTSEKTTVFNAYPETYLKNLEIHDTKTKIDTQSIKTDIQKTNNIHCPIQQESEISFVFSALSLGSCRQHKSIGDTKEAKQSTQQTKKRNLFRRKRKEVVPQKYIPKSHFVYYAKTINPHILSKNFTNQEKPQKKKDIFSSHLSNIMRKQYDLRFGIDEYSDTSQFTRPICKDKDSRVPYDSDICSCYDQFQNVDNYMGKEFLIDRGRSCVQSKVCNNAYYDSKFYDMIPVKEISECSEDKHLRAKYNNMDMSWHKTARSKPFIDNPINLNYRAETCYRYQTRQNTYNEPMPYHSRRQKHLHKKIPVYEDTSRSYSVNCGSIYTKQVFPSKITKTRDQALIKPSNERESRITVNINSKHNLGKSSKSVQLELDLLNDTKTETMLNQIRSMLQSVLTEVKTNTNINKEEKAKRDAIVQKGSSENKIEDNFSYPAPNHSYYNPYSHAYMPFGRLCFDNNPCQPVKYVQNSPYFVQSCQGRCKCSCQRRINSFYKCEKPHSFTIGTNTNKHEDNETNNLIQEIYKSVALNVDCSPNNNYPSTNYNGEKSETDVKSTVYESEVVKSNKQVEALLSTCTGNSSHSDENDSKDTITENQQENQEHAQSKLYQLYRLEQRNNRENDDIPKEDLEDSYSDSESYCTVVPRSINEKNKKGFFNRIAKFLKRRKVTHNHNIEEDLESSEESETDDYETIYSGSAKGSQYNNPPPRPMYTKRSPRINIQVNGKRIRRSPYVEQEYRRHWNEDLTSGGREQKYTQSRPGTNPSVRYKQQHTPLGRNCEARSVILNGDSYAPDSKRGSADAGKIGILKRHKLGLRCGEQWKSLILDN